MDSSTTLITNCEKCKKVQPTKGSEQLFLKSVSVWVNKPHVVNRRLCGSKIVSVSRVQHFSEVQSVLKHPSVLTIFSCKDSIVNELNFKDLTDETHPYTVIFREIIPKSEFFPKLFEAVVYDKQAVVVSFLPLSQECNKEILPTSELSYSIQFKSTSKELPNWAVGNEMVLSWSCDHSGAEDARRQQTSDWLQSVLLEKLVIWSHINDISTSTTSLKLVSIDTYKDTYIRLKNAYGRDLVKNWTERTDPKKFVYEDVAIAAYLLLIWEEERKRKNLLTKQSFVDLGCGNGLLVYILTKEGHKGLGIDLRKRNIWDTFGPEIDLKVETISPSADHLYPEYDWLIGNHSDELTPWIPVIAARTSYDCSFFVLPCCHHDFVGKFGVSEKGKSRYEFYLDYVKEIISYCGFIPESDSLRIPSTKRICFIGRKRNYEREKEAVKDVERQAFIDKRTTHVRALMAHRQKYMTAKRPVENIAKDSRLHIKNIHLTGADSVATELSDRQKISVEQSDDMATMCLDKRKFNHYDLSREVEGTSSELNPQAGMKKFKSCTGSSIKSIERDHCERIIDDSIEVDCANSFESLVNVKSRYATACPPTINQLGPSSAQVGDKAKKWASEFQPRATEQKVRNCQAVPEHIKTHIVSTVFKLVLDAPDAVLVQLESGRSWRKGGTISLNSIVDHLDKNMLQALKSECGGLQTLLRNHSYIFQVTGGRVQLRDFTQADPWLGRNPNRLKAKQQGKQPRDTKKTTLCWFHIHHPEGCPRPSEDCQFAHSETELKTKSDT